jgi:ribonucleoside-diphosphate reductase alpha chain
MVVPANVDWENKTIGDAGNCDWSWVKEGDDSLLVATFNDETYKIDSNRGLCKEQYVEDYSVTWLKENKKMWKGEDKPKWARFAFDLSTEDHVSVMSVFAKYVDSAISKTVNLPNDYPYEDFKDVYYNAWKAGIKGFTTYRHGTMANVLSTTATKKTGIIPNDAPKRPKELDCDVYHISVKGEPYFVLVGLLEGEPYEVFAGRNGVVGKKVKKGVIIKHRRRQYKAIFDDGSELSPIHAFTTEEGECLCRLISSSLRHGVNISFLVHQLEKSKGDLSSFNKSILRALKKYITDGTKVHGEECNECKGKLVRLEGCMQCLACGWSKCS